MDILKDGYLTFLSDRKMFDDVCEDKRKFFSSIECYIRKNSFSVDHVRLVGSNAEYKLMFTCQLEVCGNIIFVILNSHHIKGTLSLSWNHLIALKGNEACIRDPYVTVIFKELTKEMIRSLDEKVFSCVVLTSAHFFFFSQFSEWLQQTDITSSSSTEHDARTVFIRLSEKNVLFFQVTEGLN